MPQLIWIDNSIDLLIALVFEENVFVFYSPVCDPRRYQHPTVDLIEIPQRVYRVPPKYPIAVEIENISNLYCSYVSEVSASAFFGMNIQNFLHIYKTLCEVVKTR